MVKSFLGRERHSGADSVGSGVDDIYDSGRRKVPLAAVARCGMTAGRIRRDCGHWTWPIVNIFVTNPVPKPARKALQFE